jgi:hypothetical protein
MKYLALIVFGGLSYWAIEKYAMTDGRLFGQFEFPVDANGQPKLGVGYVAAGGVIVAGALALGAIVHKISGGHVPSGLAVSK